ncbi:RNA polymerase II subunit A C-terminal domain phosphatase ssu72 [Salinomyces thailandicus]|uniref:protein-serine/threonine phosphatase n=1 Tax=Salinomyces thailandicus TaxID=706561 RepID=A0A4U0U981_9PEZI|nr:RNA polymerase II subunit A C-terminal domain phosphatase ssu72 [Salinomyces thailandica]
MADPRRRAQAQAPPPPPPPPEAIPDATTAGLEGTTIPTTSTPPPNTSTPAGPPTAPPFKLTFCTVCASNNNRSMEAHLRLTTAPTPYPTISFGTGSLVRLPGPSITQPNVYTFNNTSYASMYHELLTKDQRLYRANGILPMLERNKGVKWGPERWQDWQVGVPRVGRRGAGEDGANGDSNGIPEAEYSDDKGYSGTEGGTADVVITCEERCWDAVVEDLLARGAPLNRPVHVFNVDIKDNHEEALVGGRAILELADALNAAAVQERETLGGEAGAEGFDRGVAAAREGFDERVPGILADWQDRWPNLPALWTSAWF